MMLLLNNHNEIWPYSLHLITQRSYSKRELQQKLHYKGYNDDSIDKVIQRLEEYSYINDLKLADNLFHKYLQANKYSIKQIHYKLKQRGLPDAILSELMKHHDDIEEWQIALKIVNIRFKDFETITKEKIYRYLASKGFSSSSIHKVLEVIYHSDT
jgi:regulatory protein